MITTAGIGTWSRRRWVTTLVSIFALHVLLIFLLSRPAPAVLEPKPTLWLGRMLADPKAQAKMRAFPWLEDPAQFGLISSRGFSGLIWGEFPVTGYPVPVWTAAPRMLALDGSRLGEGLGALLYTPSSMAQAVAQNPPAESRLLLDLPKLLPTNSSIVASEALARRHPRLPGNVPRWAYAEPLPRSTIQIGVGATGSVVAARVLKSSGLPGADHLALDLARKVEFEPEADAWSSPPLYWGEVDFLWATVEPSLPGLPAGAMAP